ncbi:alkaline phosphatase PhoX [Nonomuraea typhae]|uniref:Alkaline phosphatase PhoX n=1 Tax=Nonomuraea typhae TaxID=2603600 RepID=A0ABW7YNS1_9ACTN
MVRRTLLHAGAVVTVGTISQGTAHAGAGPYGPLLPADADGLALPQGFSGRIVARSGRKVAGLTWHAAPDGGACFPDGSGWIYVSNAEVPLLGGAAAVRFRADGSIAAAYRILSGTSLNRAGGATPWHTWLSCEATERGRVFECDPYGERAARPRLGMGRFRHGAVACDPEREAVYLTEDEPDGCFYRFRPRDWGDLTEGALEVLTGGGGWREVPHPAAPSEPTRYQVRDALRFNRGRACHLADGVCSFTTRGDDQVWSYDGALHRHEAMHGPLFVAQDGAVEIDVITRDGAVAPFARLAGRRGAELSGPAFSPDGGRLYFSSRRRGSGVAAGQVFEVSGPFERG